MYVALGAYNLGYLTLGLESVEAVVDRAGCVAVLGEGGDGRSREKERKGRRREVKEWQGGSGGRGMEKEREKERSRYGGVKLTVRDWKEIWSRGTDAVMDVPLGGVCEVLYGEGREDWNGNEDP